MNKANARHTDLQTLPNINEITDTKKRLGEK